MKTNLVDLVQTTPISKGVERPSMTPVRNSGFAESSPGRQEPEQTFNQALENHQSHQKESSFQTQSEPVKKTERSTEESRFKTAKEDQPGQNTPIREKVEEMDVEISEEETVDLDSITLSTAVQAMQQEIANDNIPLTGHEESERESKINTLLSLLSKQTDLKIPKLEQYVSTMRESGKSVQEILDTLKSVLEQTGKEETDLKNFILKIIYPKETPNQIQSSEPVSQEDSDENQILTNGKTPVKILNVDPQMPAEKQVEGEVPMQAASEEKTSQSIPEEFVGKAVLSDEITENAPSALKEAENIPTQDEPVPMEPKITVNADQLPETLQLLRDKVNALLDQVDQVSFKGTSQNVSVKEIQVSTTHHSDLNVEIPERLVEALSERLNVSKEAIVDFLNSNLIPKDKLQSFIQSFNTVDPQVFIQNNEALMSQMKAFIKLHHHLDSGSKLTLQTRSITVETTLIKQLILNRFNSNGFNSEFFNGKDKILFKSSQSVFTVEKMSVRFVSKSVQVETSDKGFLKANDGDFLEKAVQTTKRFFQQTFKNGYETSSQRISDLERFHAKANPADSQSEHLASKVDKQISLDERAPVGEKATETKFQTVSMSEEKELKGTKSSFEQESNSHSSEVKSSKSFADTVVKNEQPNQVRNLEQVYQKIKDMTQLMARQQTRTELATIKLNPPELGRVSLEVVKEGNKISILMQVETKEAQEILNKNSNLLAARLVNSGFDLQKVTVQMEKYEEQGNNQSNQNNENNAQQQGNENQDNNNENEYPIEEEYTFADLLKGGIEENAS